MTHDATPKLRIKFAVIAKVDVIGVKRGAEFVRVKQNSWLQRFVGRQYIKTLWRQP